MKILTNFTRELLGGITTTNDSLIRFFLAKGHRFIGLELGTERIVEYPKRPTSLAKESFGHYIVNLHDKSLEEAITSAGKLEELKRFYRRPIEELTELIKKESPDLVLANGTSYFPWLIAIAAKESGVPTVLRYHGVITKETENLECRKHQLFMAMEKSFSELVDYFIFPSELCKKTVEEEVFGRKMGESVIVPNPVEPATESYLGIGCRNIAMVARISWIKNVQQYFDLHDYLLREGWQHKASLVCEERDKAVIPTTITHLPPMDGGRLGKFYARQGLVISTSRFETFGNVPMEAVSLGVPVLVGRNMGCAEILSDVGLDEMIYNTDSIPEIAEKVKMLCGSSVDKSKVENIKKMLNPGRINGMILKALTETIRL